MQPLSVKAYSVLAVTTAIVLLASLAVSLASLNRLPIAAGFLAFASACGAVMCVGSIPVIRSCERRVGSLTYNHDSAMQSLKQAMSVIGEAYDGIVMTDPWGVIRYVNPAWEKITGYSSEEAVGKLTPAVLKSGKHGPDFYSKMWLTIQHGERFHDEMINKRKDGSLYRVDEIILPLKDKEGKVTGYAAFHHDITAQRPVA